MELKWAPGEIWSRLDTDELVEQLKRRILEHVKAESIILFGSSAAGRAMPDSDLDILVVWDEEGQLSNRERRIRLRQAIGYFPAPLDVLTCTTDELQSALKDPDSFTSQIVKNGKVVYGRL